MIYYNTNCDIQSKNTADFQLLVLSFDNMKIYIHSFSSLFTTLIISSNLTMELLLLLLLLQPLYGSTIEHICVFNVCPLSYSSIAATYPLWKYQSSNTIL